MIQTKYALKCSVGVLAAVVLFVSVSQADAARFRRLAVAQEAAAQPDVAVQAAVPCCPTPCIVYRHIHRHRRVCCDTCCTPPIKVTLAVQDPCRSDCVYDIPVCVPACCTGEPTVCVGRGLFGRSTISYRWCCGFEVTVAFRRCGDVLVTSSGAL